ncbi:MAG: sigma-70 family RNA polymerase sigma factor [Deltaproteobacteria bacterium]|nr:sigma-70 family RNA polymerase sigma factor [Deltaproteobacteria bacterium]
MRGDIFEAQWCCRLLGEDTAAVDVEALYRRYGPMVLRRCRRLLGDEQRALDAMQDVFVQVLRYRDRLTGDAPSSLLYRIATNVCLNRLRSIRRKPEEPQDDVLCRIAAAGDIEQQSLARLALERIFGREPVSTRAMAVMHLVDGMTLEEVARESKLSVSGVRKRLRMLRAHVQELALLG